MKIYLHIGQSKTGTSAIQSFLTLNRNILSKEGILYPAIKIKGLTIDIGSHNALADSLVGLSRFPYLTTEEYFKQFFSAAKKQNIDQLVLSAEHFFGGEPRVWDINSEEEYFLKYEQKIKTLAKYLKGHDVSIILYLRPQIDWFASTIGQTIRIEGLIKDRSVYSDDLQFFKMLRPLLRYYDLVERWQVGFPDSEIKIIPYVKENLYQGSSISDFLNHINMSHIKFPEIHKKVQVNVSLTREYLEVKKIYNKSKRNRIQERIAIKSLERLSKMSNKGSTYQIAPNVMEKLEEISDKQNMKLNQFYGDKNYQFVNKKSYKGEQLEPLTDQEIDQAMTAFHNEYENHRAYYLAFEYNILSFLRKNARPAHSVLHQFKRIYRKIKYNQLKA